MRACKQVIHAPAPGGLPVVGDELGPAVLDVTFQLAHDLSDTPAGLRDALAFAPLAGVKMAQRCAGYLAARPGRSLGVLAGLAAVVVTGFALARRKRS